MPQFLRLRQFCRVPVQKNLKIPPSSDFYVVSASEILSIILNFVNEIKLAMKRILLSFAILASSVAGLRAQDTKAFFQLPVIPDEIQTLQGRSDYLMEHYWDFCDLDKAFSSRDRMAEAFDTYISFIPYASAEVVYEQVGKFMDRVGKKPQNALFIGELAEGKLYSDTATMQSDELFVIFAKKIVDNKKIDKTSKLRYRHLIQVLEGSAPGSVAPVFEYEDPFGVKGTFAVDTAKIGTILFFNDPECDDCQLAKLRLDTDIVTRRMVEGGKMDIVTVYASDATPEWSQKALDLPKEWKNVASEQVNDLYDLRMTPMFYVINPNGAILMKTVNVNDIIAIMSRLQAALGHKASKSNSRPGATAPVEPEAGADQPE